MPRQPRPPRPSPALTRRAALLGLAASAAGARAQPAAEPPAAAAAAEPFVLRAAPLARRVGPGEGPSSALWAFNGAVPGPVVRARKGAPAVLRFVNDLPVPASLHLYGLRGEADAMAGLTEAPVAPGASRDYAVTDRDAGTFWYHAVVPGRVAEGVERGLAGAIVVEEALPPPVDHDVVLVLDDWRLGPDGALDEAFRVLAQAAGAGRLGGLLTVNGAPAPGVVTARPGARLRLRLVNVAGARVLPLRLRAGAAIVAIDGQPVEPFDPLKRQAVLAPGSRYEAIVDAPTTPGEEVAVAVTLGAGLPVLRLVTEGEPLPPRPPIAALPPSDYPPEIRLQGAARAEFAIGGGLARAAPGAPPLSAEDLARRFPDRARLFTVNQGFAQGFAGRPLLSAKRGTPVVLALANRTAWTQSVHLHGHALRLLHPYDDGWDPYLADTVLVPEGVTHRVAFVADRPGRHALRSSNLEHFEGGVASWIEVT